MSQIKEARQGGGTSPKRLTTFSKRYHTMRRFIVTTEGENRLGLRQLCQRFADERWMAAHMTPQQAAESVLDEFRKAVAAELAMLDVHVEDEPADK